MKILIGILLFFGTYFQAQAQGINYNSGEFRTCMSVYNKSLIASEATARCEELYRNGEISIMVSEQFGICYDMANRSLSSHEAGNLCLEYQNSDVLKVFLENKFSTCHAINNRSLSSHIAVNKCVSYYKSGELNHYIDSNFLQCVAYRNVSLSSHHAVEACLSEFKSVGSQSSLTLEQVNNNIQVPENTQIILKTAIEMPGKQSCVAAKDGARDVKCWVCRAKESRNDVLYRLEKDEATGLSQKILPVTEAKLSTDGKEIHFPLVHDSSDTDNLSLILCSSKRPFQIKSRAELLPILESNDLKLIIPAPKEK